GDIVQFAGGKHYANAQAANGTTVKPGPAKVTAVATAGKHPYHLVHTDSTSTVYGWVDAAAITGKVGTGTTAAKTYTVKAGDSLWRIAAQQLGNGARYKEIKTLNGLKNDTIHAGQVLKLPN
ncbi:MAG: LysM peptidoglycan-binding domain-containing protein, partial [Acutalibacteraceae bacterium]